MNQSEETDPKLPNVDPIVLGDTVVVTFYDGEENPIRTVLVHDRCTARIVLEDALRDDPKGLSEILEAIDECPDLPELALEKSDYEIPSTLLERFTELMLYARIACNTEESGDAAEIFDRRYRLSSRLLVAEMCDDGSTALIVFVTASHVPIVTIVCDPETRDRILEELELLVSPKDLAHVREICAHVQSPNGAGSYRGNHVLASMLALGYRADEESDEPEPPAKQYLS